MVVNFGIIGGINKCWCLVMNFCTNNKTTDRIMDEDHSFVCEGNIVKLCAQIRTGRTMIAVIKQIN